LAVISERDLEERNLHALLSDSDAVGDRLDDLPPVLPRQLRPAVSPKPASHRDVPGTQAVATRDGRAAFLSRIVDVRILFLTPLSPSAMLASRRLLHCATCL
jgi:hypothetical protein